MTANNRRLTLCAAVVLGIAFMAASPLFAESADSSSALQNEGATLDSAYESTKRTQSAFYDQTNPLTMMFVLFINIYQRTLSAREGVSTCQFRPSCSHYGALSIKNYGVLEGTLMTGDRLLRCNPWAKEHYPLWHDNLHLYDPPEDHDL